MTGTCRFCGKEHALAGWKNRTEIFQGAACFMHALFANEALYDFVPDWRSVAQLFSAYYFKDGTCTGGNLHVVIDDTNIDDRSIHWTRGFCDALNDDDGAILMGLLVEMPMIDRAYISEKVGGRDGEPLPEDWRPGGVAL